MSDIVNDSQIDNDVEEVFEDESQDFDVREAFGLPAKESEEESEEGEQSVNDKPPAKEEVTTKRVVKFNKEDREVDESEVEGLLQKGLALDKERERKTELEKTLERVAKLEGVSVADYLANLDKKEAQAVEKAKNAFDETRQKVIDDLVYNGVSQEDAEAYADNNPYVAEAKKAIQEREASKAVQESQTYQQSVKSQWDEVYASFPDIEKRDIAFDGTQVMFAGEGTPDWLTPDMIARLEKGYSPKDAFVLSHGDQLSAKTKKQTEQKLIKQQQLSSRSKVADDGEQENRASEELKGAFAMFGIDPKRAQKYAK